MRAPFVFSIYGRLIILGLRLRLRLCAPCECGAPSVFVELLWAERQSSTLHGRPPSRPSWATSTVFVALDGRVKPAHGDNWRAFAPAGWAVQPRGIAGMTRFLRAVTT